MEFADVAAVVDAAAATGSQVDLLGHSYGGSVASGAAALSPNLRRPVLYEGWPTPNLAHRTISPHLMATVESLLAQHRPEQMLETFYRDLVLMSDEEGGAVRVAPTWTARVARPTRYPESCAPSPTTPSTPPRRQASPSRCCCWSEARALRRSPQASAEEVLSFLGG